MAEVGTTTAPEWMLSPAPAVDESRTIAVFEVAYSWTHVYIVSIFLGFLIICITCGNALVVLAVLTERHLRVRSSSHQNKHDRQPFILNIQKSMIIISYLYRRKLLLFTPNIH